MSLPSGSRDLVRIVLGVLLILLLISGALSILSPFLPALIWATMIVVATWPLLLQLQRAHVRGIQRRNIEPGRVDERRVFAAGHAVVHAIGKGFVERAGVHAELVGERHVVSFVNRQVQ